MKMKITRFKVIPTKDGVDCPIIEEKEEDTNEQR